ncbi:hypothetical protein CEP52_009611 [Fusarium oligoseptatum]|uniref:Uncharacterized protein n=1 Tax=Fusarium oligoseptatum TaxID=2604345 RepID=A0A428TCC2_9HYPO|nr:hypothetical protein CEP52_009611 [Fusarium oligoseptatum]
MWYYLAAIASLSETTIELDWTGLDWTGLHGCHGAARVARTATWRYLCYLALLGATAWHLLVPGTEHSPTAQPLRFLPLGTG